MRLVAILRIKDQILTIDECLSKLSSLVDDIIILDNGSTDGTLRVYIRYPKISKVLHTESFDEGRDKIMLLNEAKQTGADWIVWIDGDEIFENHLTRNILDEYMNSSYNQVLFRMCNFWLNKRWCRYDGEYYLYTLHPQRSMWRNVGSAYFRNQKIHNGGILGIRGRAFLSPYRIKHFGYVDPEKIAEKVATYRNADNSGKREYLTRADIVLQHKTFPFIEYENTFLNYSFILFYKYLCNTLWFIERIRQKLLNGV